MKRQLRFTEKARDDLDALRHWLTQPGSGMQAIRLLAAVRTDIRRLKTYPCLYAVGAHQGVRELPCAGGYRVLYRVTPDTGRSDTAGDVLVLRLYGPGQSRSAT